MAREQWNELVFESFDWLALEVRDLEAAVSWYSDVLGLAVAKRGDRWVSLAVGKEHLLLCEPQLDPRGGVHVHYALSITPDAYENWLDRVDAVGPVHEADFGGFRSLYVFDPDDHCVELATAAPADVGARVAGTFEVVLEVRDLAQAEARYRALGATVTGRGEDRRRLRLDAGAIDLELWEPQLGIADGRGGLHVTMAGRTGDLTGLEGTAREQMDAVEAIDTDAGTRTGVRIRDSDGHAIEFRPPA